MACCHVCPARRARQHPRRPLRPPQTEATTHSEAVVGLPLAEDEWRLLSSGDVVTMIESSDTDTVRAIGLYEETHRRRRLVIEAVRRRLEP